MFLNNKKNPTNKLDFGPLLNFEPIQTSFSDF